MTIEPPRTVAVIDIGKTNAKVAIIGMEALAEIAVRTRPNAAPYPHYDVGGLWAFILDALGELNREHAIDAITVATHGAACALLDGQGNLALPVLDYEHDGPDALRHIRRADLLAAAPLSRCVPQRRHHRHVPAILEFSAERRRRQ